MTRFIEFTDKSGVRALVNLQAIDEIVDMRSSIRIIMREETIILSIGYNTFKAWLRDTKPILEARQAL